MKQLILLVLGFMTLSCLAQDIQIIPNNNDRPTMEELLGNLNFSEITSGFLLDKGLQLEPVYAFDGDETTDANLLNSNRFGRLYATMNNSAMRSDALLPHPATTYRAVQDTLSNDAPIPIAILDLYYHKFKEDALKNNLISESNNQFFDVINRPESPYEQHLLFAGSALRNTLQTFSPEFIFSDDLYFSNTGADISSITIDFADGQGVQTAMINLPIRAHYAEEGMKKVEFEIIFTDGSRKKAHFKVNIVESGYATGSRFSEEPNFVETIFADLVDVIDADSDGEDDALGSATISFFSQCEDASLRKPLIYIEGFDPMISENTDYKNIDDRLTSFLLTPGGISLKDHLDNSGYDIIYVDFTDGADYIERNAMVVKNVIRRVNELKRENGSAHKNVVIGNSMGGLVAKYALLDFEINNEDHETEKLLTHDTPFIGANIPVSVQFLADQLINLNTPIPDGISISWEWPFIDIDYAPLKDYVEELENIEKALMSPAAQQMLLYNIYSDGSLHVDFYNDLNSKPEPEFFEHVAISNGAIVNDTPTTVDERAQIISAGELMFEIDGEIISEAYSAIASQYNIPDFIIFHTAFALQATLGIQANVEIKLWALPDNPSNYENIYKGDISIILFHHEISQSYKHCKVRETIPYDSSPGGMLGADLSTGLIPDLIAEGFPLTINSSSFCHSPVVGSTGLIAPFNNDLFFDLSDPMQVVNDNQTVVDRYIGATMNGTWYGVSQRNQPHVSFSAANAAFYISELVFGFPINLGEDLAETYNFGKSSIMPTIAAPFVETPDYIDQDVILKNGVELWINRQNRIGTVSNLTNPQNQINSHFDVYTQTTNCDDESEFILIRVNDQSKIILGDWTGAEGNTGNLHLGNGTILHIDNGGLIEVDDNSKLIIKSGAEVTVQSGGLLNPTWHSQVIVEAGGLLRIESGGILRASHMAQVWIQPGGQLILEDGAIVQTWDGQDPDGRANIKFGGEIIDPDNTPAVAELVIEGEFDWGGNGFLDFSKNMNMELVGDANFRLDGKGKEYRFIRLSGGSILVNKNKIHLTNGEVQYTSSASQIGLSGTAYGIFYRVAFNGTGNESAITAKDCRYMRVVQCDFRKLLEGVSASGLTDAFLLDYNLYLDQCRFNDVFSPVFAGELENILLRNSSISGGGLNGVGLLHVDNFYLTNSSIEEAEFGILSDGVANFVMRGGNISNCSQGIRLQDNFSETTIQTNVDLAGGATIENNYYGILVEPVYATGNTPPMAFPMITMDCARLIHNHIGISGEDIILNIDASGELATNHFAEGSELGSKIFEICYDALLVNEIDAQNNFWSTEKSRQINSTSLPGGCVSANGTGNVSLNFVVEADEYGACSNGNTGGEPTGGGDVPVPEFGSDEFNKKMDFCLDSKEKKYYNLYWNAYKNYVSETFRELPNHKESLTQFTEVANIPLEKVNDLSEKCKMLIYMARSRTRLGASHFANEDTRKTSINSEEELTGRSNTNTGGFLQKGDEFRGVMVYPNPVKDQLYFQTENDEFTRYKIVDAMGRFWLEGKIDKGVGKMKIDVSSLNNGMYMLHLQSETVQWETVRFVVSN